MLAREVVQTKTFGVVEKAFALERDLVSVGVQTSVTMPPSTGITAPVTYAPARDAR